MFGLRFVGFSVVLVPLLSIGCGQSQPGSSQAAATQSFGAKPAQSFVDDASANQKPTPPLELPVPPASSRSFEGRDLSKLDSDELLSAADTFYRRGKFHEAVQLQYWGIQEAETGLYNMACYCALAGSEGAAFYWLQEAALREGVDVDWANRDSDLASLRRNRRWPAMHKFLIECNDYWTRHGSTEDVLVAPHGYANDRPLPVLVGLHGLGHNAHGFIGVDNYQELADKLGVAFVGVSGTIPKGPTSFVWAEDAARDAKRIASAIESLADRLTVAKGKIIAFGFSQGAQVAIEVAARDPDRYAGAIVLSPGVTGSSTLNAVTASPLIRKRGFVIVCGAGEHPGNVAQAKSDAVWAKNANAHLIHHAYREMTSHTYPPDYWEKLPDWIHFILEAQRD